MSVLIFSERVRAESGALGAMVWAVMIECRDEDAIWLNDGDGSAGRDSGCDCSCRSRLASWLS